MGQGKSRSKHQNTLSTTQNITRLVHFISSNNNNTMNTMDTTHTTKRKKKTSVTMEGTDVQVLGDVIPMKVFVHICQYLRYYEMFQLPLVCHQYNQYFHQDSFFHTLLLDCVSQQQSTELFTCKDLTSGIIPKSLNIHSWKELFIARSLYYSVHDSASHVTLKSRKMRNSDHISKVCLVGKSFSGKTSFSTRLLEDTWSQEYNGTLGAEFSQVSIKHKSNRWRIQIWDISPTIGHGHEKVYLRDASIIVYCFDVNSEESFNHLIQQMEEVQQQPQDNLLIVGLKSDLKLNNYLSYKALEYCIQNKCMYCECSSAESKESVDGVFRIVADLVCRKSDSNDHNNEKGNTASDCH
jgi:GTPase SAR1 family protein